jgi:hypothetical protein
VFISNIDFFPFTSAINHVEMGQRVAEWAGEIELHFVVRLMGAHNWVQVGLGIIRTEQNGLA